MRADAVREMLERLAADGVSDEAAAASREVAYVHRQRPRAKRPGKGEAERTALFNTWLNAVLLMPDVREHEETKVWLGIEKASKVPAAISLDYSFGSH